VRSNPGRSIGTIGGTCSGTPVMVSPATRSTAEAGKLGGANKGHHRDAERATGLCNQTTGTKRETELVAHVPGDRAAQCILCLSQIVGAAVEEINVKAVP
jgi:hypothetical protein